MSLNDSPRGERIHIALFGKRNAGKSSLINAITGQDLAIVSEQKGTTTDPVLKAMELLPLGPVVMIDTPGLDDSGELGERRVEKALEVLKKTDIALVVLEVKAGVSSFEENLIQELKKRNIPWILVYNKIDQLDKDKRDALTKQAASLVSASTGEGVQQLKERIASLAPQEADRQLVAELLAPNDWVVLVVPIDSAAPKGRLILPQQQVIRDVLEAGAVAIVTKETELKDTLQNLGKTPRIVITDSQAFEQVAKETPKEIPLTSFSILFARYKGDLRELIKGAEAVAALQDGDKILIAEGCTHHRQCDDIGTVKIPRWLQTKTGKQLVFETSSGTGFPKDLKQYALIVHCGGCMLNRREVERRIEEAAEAGVPIVNYGVLIASLKGILSRTVQPFVELDGLTLPKKLVDKK